MPTPTSRRCGQAKWQEGVKRPSLVRGTGRPPRGLDDLFCGDVAALDLHTYQREERAQEMASRKSGRVTYKKDLSPTLSIFRLIPEKGSAFPAYQAGQYIALGRDDGRLTKKVGVDPTALA